MKRMFLACFTLLITTFCHAAPHVTFKTTLGDIDIELFPKEAPITVKNFITYTQSGFYNGTIFHRVIKDFVVQGGGFTPTMQEKANNPPIKNEATNNLLNVRGTLSMARTNDIDSATSQFFINLKDNTMLDHTQQNFGYAVFGKVVKGMDVVDKIAEQPTGNVGMFQDVPQIPIVINTAVYTK
jgi:peptidyl-prolyl cis-trans isomerase A (cyclophilin A)